MTKMELIPKEVSTDNKIEGLRSWGKPSEQGRWHSSAEEARISARPGDAC